ncbi:MAG: hypothetical protein KDJ16_07580 [Hyphomicrobiales bacterium]|nr:hypothetical protein [Hyphomicrobiales bacterium]
MTNGGLDFWTLAVPVTGLALGFLVAMNTEGFWPPVIAAFIGAGMVRGIQYFATNYDEDERR